MTNTTWNPSDKSAATTLSGGNLVASFSLGSPGVRSVDRVYSGKYYWEITFTTVSNTSISVCTGGTVLTSLNVTGTVGDFAVLSNAGLIFKGTTNVASTGGTVTNGWIGCVALDATNGWIWFRNGAAGNWNGSASADPATGVGGVSIAAWATSGHTGIYAAANGGSGGGVVTANFGASGFTGTVPSGFTSGFPSGTSIVLEALATQVAVEEWGPGAPDLRMTQLFIEEWGSGSLTNQLLMTQLAAEQWGVVPRATGQPQTAITVVT